MRTFALFLTLSLASVALSAQPTMPRKAPEFTVVTPDGKQALLSSYKGKVIALAFIFTTCPHCQAECGVLTKLQSELGDKGFQPLAVAFNDNAGLLVNDFVKTYHPSFPVGYSSRETVMNYLGLSDIMRWSVPQMVLIDRKGMIVAQSAPGGSAELQEEGSLKQKLMELLGPGKTMSKKTGL